MEGMALVKGLEARGNVIFNEKKTNTYQISKKSAECLFAFIYKYQSILDDINDIKARLDDAFVNVDVSAFEKTLNEFKNVAYGIWTEKKKLKSRRKLAHLKIHSDLFNDAYRKIAFVENTITGGEKWIKQQLMSPSRRIAAEKTSVRMKMMWG